MLPIFSEENMAQRFISSSSIIRYAQEVVSGHVLIKPQDAGHPGSWQEQNQFIVIPIPINVLPAINISPEDDCSFLPAIGGSTGARLG